MTILDPKAQRMLRESEETALALVEDRGRSNALARAIHCMTRDPSRGFWRAVRDAILAMPEEASR